jgi:hypothetical protein
VGSIKEFLDVFFDAGLLNPELLVTGDDQPDAPSLAIRNYELLCSDNNTIDYACLKKEFGDQFPEYGLTVAEYNTQGGKLMMVVCSEHCARYSFLSYPNIKTSSSVYNIYNHTQRCKHKKYVPFGEQMQVVFL